MSKILAYGDETLHRGDVSKTGPEQESGSLDENAKQPRTSEDRRQPEQECRTTFIFTAPLPKYGWKWKVKFCCGEVSKQVGVECKQTKSMQNPHPKYQIESEYNPVITFSKEI